MPATTPTLEDVRNAIAATVNHYWVGAEEDYMELPPDDRTGHVFEDLETIQHALLYNTEGARYILAPAFTPQEVGTMLAAIVHGATKLDGPSLTLLESAEQKLRAMYGLPTGPA